MYLWQDVLRKDISNTLIQVDPCKDQWAINVCFPPDSQWTLNSVQFSRSVVSDSLRPHESQQPTRLPRPWDSPGKNTGVGCHVLLQCMTVKSENEITQSCPTLRNPMDCSPPGSSVHGTLQARVREWVAIAFSTRPPGNSHSFKNENTENNLNIKTAEKLLNEL